MNAIVDILGSDGLILLGMFGMLLFLYYQGTPDGSDVLDDSAWRPTLKDENGKLPHEVNPPPKWK